jgi:CTP-dependent riboflavin kinase
MDAGLRPARPGSLARRVLRPPILRVVGTLSFSIARTPAHSRGCLSGTVEPGSGLGAGRMADRGVMETLQELSGFPVVPGTLNVRLRRPLERGPSWHYMPAAEITPDWEERTGQAGYFLASVTVARRYRGLAFQAVEPGEHGYPPDQIELLCEAHLRRELGLGDGDLIEVRLDEV